MLRAALVLLGLAFVCGAPAPGLAWTRTHVRAVRAHVQLLDERSVRVELALDVEVQGGWLERLDLTGFEPELALDSERPAWLETDLGERVAPEIFARDGAISLRFRRRDGLKRGHYQAHVTYIADLRSTPGSQDGTAGVQWELPGWEAGLREAEVVLEGPASMSAISDDDVAQRTDVSTQAGRARLRFARVHVPRESPWLVRAALTAGELPAGAPRGLLGIAATPRRPWVGVALGAFALLLALTSRAHVRRQLKLSGFKLRGVLARGPAPTWWAVVTATVGAACWSLSLPAAIAGWLLTSLACWELPGEKPALLRLGHFAPLTRDDLARAALAVARQRRGRLPWLDASSAVGALGAVGLVALVATFPSSLLAYEGEPWGLGLLCALPAWLLSSHRRLPRTLDERLVQLGDAAETLSCEGCLLRLVWYVVPAEHAEEPRLRILPAVRHSGLLRLELLADTRRAAEPLWLSVVVESGSAAARWTRELYASARVERSVGGSREAIIVPCADADAMVSALLRHLGACGQRAVDGAAGPRRAA